MRRAWILLLAACSQVGSVEPIIGKVDEGRELIGTPAPSLAGISWTDGQVHPLTEERGKVVLVRWWTDTCPLCANSAKAIHALAQEYGDDLVIRAVYHNKVAGRDVTPAGARAMADRVGYPWLVGLDPQWETLRAWWLTDRRSTAANRCRRAPASHAIPMPATASTRPSGTRSRC
ncbi:MAG: TlpA family protein disulfide reductase [Planctomycetota bacterium]|jgi:thiol-disulfide isomerase/thioredoxin